MPFITVRFYDDFIINLENYQHNLSDVLIGIILLFLSTVFWCAHMLLLQLDEHSNPSPWTAPPFFFLLGTLNKDYMSLTKKEFKKQRVKHKKIRQSLLITPESLWESNNNSLKKVSPQASKIGSIPLKLWLFCAVQIPQQSSITVTMNNWGCSLSLR